MPLQDYNGTWTPIKYENFKAFMGVAGIPAPMIEKLEKFQGTTKIQQEGVKLIMDITLPVGVIHLDFTADGSQSEFIHPIEGTQQFVASVEGDKLVTTGSTRGKKIDSSYAIENGQLVVTRTCEGVSCKQFFDKS